MLISSIKKIVASALILLGLTGLVDNIVEWVGFVGRIVSEYQSVRDYLFGWFPFEVANWLKDYMVVGSGVASSYYRMKNETGLKAAAWELVLVWVVNCILWPIIVFVSLAALLIRKTDRLKEDEKYHEVITAFRLLWKNIATVFLVYLCILFVFSDALTKLTGL